MTTPAVTKTSRHRFVRVWRTAGTGSTSRHRATTSALVLALCVLVLGACGTTPEIVEIGGAQSTTVDRPWGTVKTFPTMQKAQEPNQVELDFVGQMITHHEQAVELSDSVLRHQGIEPRVTASAQFIAQDQTNEIAAMGAWLKAWNAPRDAHEHHAHHDMPGMVPGDEISRFQMMPAEEAPAEFVRLMIFHHEGAVSMSQDVLTEAHNTFVLNIARHLIREQSLEIGYLRRLSTEL